MEYRVVYPSEVFHGYTDTAMYVMMLFDPIHDMKVPIMIGKHEAEMMMIEQDQQELSRPMTYQLISSVLDTFSLTLKEVHIDRFVEGIFYANLVISDGISTKEIDARASDAVLLALHNSVTILIAENIIEQIGIKVDTDNKEGDYAMTTIADLEEELRQCEEEENYERAEEIMKQINKMKQP